MQTCRIQRAFCIDHSSLDKVNYTEAVGCTGRHSTDHKQRMTNQDGCLQYSRVRNMID